MQVSDIWHIQVYANQKFTFLAMYLDIIIQYFHSLINFFLLYI